MEVIDATVAGYTNKGMAQKLSISEQTVKHHLTNIFDKLGVFNRMELLLFAVEHQPDWQFSGAITLPTYHA